MSISTDIVTVSHFIIASTLFKSSNISKSSLIYETKHENKLNCVLSAQHNSFKVRVFFYILRGVRVTEIAQ